MLRAGSWHLQCMAVWKTQVSGHLGSQDPSRTLPSHVPEMPCLRITGWGATSPELPGVCVAAQTGVLGPRLPAL